MSSGTLQWACVLSLCPYSPSLPLEETTPFSLSTRQRVWGCPTSSPRAGRVNQDWPIRTPNPFDHIDWFRVDM